MAELVRKQTVTMSILKGGDEAVVISDGAGDEIVWTAAEEEAEYEIRFTKETPFKDSSGNPKYLFKASKKNPARTGKGYYRLGGDNRYEYEIWGPQIPMEKGPIPLEDQPTSPGSLLKDPIVIVEP